MSHKESFMTPLGYLQRLLLFVNVGSLREQELGPGGKQCLVNGYYGFKYLLVHINEVIVQQLTFLQKLVEYY